MRIVFSIIIISIFTVFFSIDAASAEVIHNSLGKINDLLVSESSKIYFFELDETITSDTWIHDTRIMYSNGTTARPVSESLFLYPTELNEMDNHLVFAVLSEQCLGLTMCDYQDIVKMSKESGNFEILAHDLKSAVHISIENDVIFVSESNGKIWEIPGVWEDRKLLYEGENLIMDMTTSTESVFWIEEEADLKSMVLGIDDKMIPKIIASDLEIPYDISESGGLPYWKEIVVAPFEGRAAEYTKSTIFENGSLITVAQLENQNPFSSNLRPTYGPYLFLGDFLFVANNTDASSIHLIDLDTNQNFELERITYSPKFFRNSEDSLYIIGQDNNGFLIEKVPLPVKVPEFGVAILVAIVGGFAVIVSSRLFSQSLPHQGI